MSDKQTPEDRAPWTIKGVSVETRKLAVAHATKRSQTMAQWLDVAVRNQAAVEAGDRLVPPAERGEQAIGPGAVVQPMTALAQVLEAAHNAQQASGVPLPKSVARHAYALIGANLRAARGLPPLKRRVTTVEVQAGLPGEKARLAYTADQGGPPNQ